MRILVCYARYASTLAYFDDWLDAFRVCRLFSVEARNICRRDVRTDLRRSIGEFDAIVLLHSTNSDTMEYLEPYRGVLEARRGILASFVGNEVNLPGSPLGDKIGFLRDVGADLIFTQLLPEAGAWLYAETGARVESVPHALNPRAFRPVLSDPERPVDVGTRSARYTAYLGDDERNVLFERVAAAAQRSGLVVDIRTDVRLDRVGWSGFLNRCRGTPSNEAGSYFLERDDKTVERIRTQVLAEARGLVIPADSPLRTVAHRLPSRLRAILRRLLRRGPLRHEALVSEEVEFERTYGKFFAGRPRAPVYSKCVSSRHFDAAGTRTAQLLLRGRYNDVFEADRHYFAIERDFSNVDEVLERFSDPGQRATIANAAYELVTECHTYTHRMSQVHSLLEAAGA